MGYRMRKCIYYVIFLISSIFLFSNIAQAIDPALSSGPTQDENQGQDPSVITEREGPVFPKGPSKLTLPPFTFILYIKSAYYVARGNPEHLVVAYGAVNGVRQIEKFYSLVVDLLG